ncbi:glycosyltransferase family 2 protein [Pseudomonas sp. ABC1]|uniref:glycosyltransferase family 2 protein n=1 Tax=Pseudomonas sp. ABC1 TaxID=2748080 RepID=UPI0015C3B84B|nr:glycosyltransferase family 2 protein [Pseudomonas sp. ABC1]QLF94164.1 glycosyltransferase family 2 protein [Pseudomonas sp. ABC1]
MSSLSVLLPVYNAAAFLRETLDSVIDQSHPPDQIVIIDDGSNDGSLSILEDYARKESRIELHAQPNGGVSRARNRGLELCQGDFIALMDADDINHPQRFERQLAATQRHALDVCGCAMRTFGQKQRTLRYPGDSAQLKSNYLFFGRTIPGPTALLRRSSIGDRHFEESLSYAEDFGFYFSLLMDNPSIRLHNLQQPLYRYRTHDQQASQQLAHQNRTNLDHIFRQSLPEAGIACPEHLLASHWRLWKEHEALSPEELRDYLPFMQQLCDWLHSGDQDKRPTYRLWSILDRRHRHLGADTQEMIAAAAASSRPGLWQRMAVRLLPRR